MNAPQVDVPAVLDEAHDWLYRSSEGRGDDERAAAVKQASAAVSELIEREKVEREALETCERWFAQFLPTAPLINELGDAEHPMLSMIRAALARTGSAP